MYGYVIPDKPNMFVKDLFEFRAYYCGLCKCIGKTQGQAMRLSTNYDATFLNAFLHSLKNAERTIKKARCVFHPIRSREIVTCDAISLQVIDFNTILTWYKLYDDRLDGKPKRTAETVVKRKYKAAKSRHAKLDEICAKYTGRLVELEKEKSTSLDMTSDCFGNLMAESVAYLAGEKSSEAVKNFAYGVGRWIYIIDALDDVDEDFKKKNYNPFVERYGCGTKAELIKNHEDDVKLLINGVYDGLKTEYDKITLGVSEGVVTNIIYYGIPFMTGRVLRSEKCEKIRL